MGKKILLVYNSPKAVRYFRQLAENVPGLRIATAGVGFAARGPTLGDAERLAIADGSLARKRARPRIPPWRQRFYAWAYRYVAQWHFNHACRLIERHRPDAVGVWGGQAVDVRAVLFAARRAGLGTFTFENGLLPGTTTCDPKGVNYDNSIPRDPAFYQDYQGGAELPEKLVPRAPRKAMGDAKPLPENYFFCPFQVRLDSQVILYSPWIRNLAQFFEANRDAFREFVRRTGATGWKLVFKRHPSCPEQYPDLRAEAENSKDLMFADGNSTDELIRNAKGVITLNSTVGIEALLLDRPVLTLGQACYAIPGVAGAATDVAAISDWMQHLAAGTLPAAVNRIPFLNYLAADYCIPGSFRSPDAAHYAAIARRMGAVQ